MKAYSACHEPFQRYCSALAYSKMDAEDLVQDVLISAYKHFEKIQKKDNLLHYLIRAAKNRSISVWRKRKKETALMDKHTDRLSARGVSADTMYDIHLLYEAMNKLPDSQRDAIILFEISGFSMKEIAEIQNSKEGAVKTKVSRGRVKLKELMAERQAVEMGSDTLKTIAL